MAPHSRNNLLCCASPACCLQSRSCQTESHKDAGSSHALRKKKQTGFYSIQSTTVLQYCVLLCVILTYFLRQCGELINMLACVLAAGHAEAELKIKALQQLVAEVVSLDHAEVVDGSVSNCELHSTETREEDKSANVKTNENLDLHFVLLGGMITKLLQT